MKKLLVLLVLCFFAVIAPTHSHAATPQKIVFDNNTSAVLYVYITAHNSGTFYQSNITRIPASSATYFNMHAGNMYTPVSWPSTPPAGSEFWGVEYFEYDPTSSCSPGPAIPSSGCSFISSNMNISSVPASSTCMETSASSCATVGHIIINGNVSAVYWKSMNVSFF